jgi:hypothetical protein
MTGKLFSALLLILSISVCPGFPGGLLAEEGSSGKSTSHLRTGMFLSLGQMNYRYKDFESGGSNITAGDPSDLFLCLTLRLKNHLELNLLYNRSTEDFSPEPLMISYDRDGFGLEAGGILPVHLFRKDSFDVYLDFVAGGYGLFYPFKRLNSGGNVDNYLLPENSAASEKDAHYQFGLYWAIRLRYMILGKVSLEVGYKSLLPVKSNEFKSRRGKEILLYKSFFTIGITF